VFVDTPGFQTRHGNALNRSLNKTVRGAIGDVDLVLFVVEAGSSPWATPRCWNCCSSRQAGAAGGQQARPGAPPRRDRALAAGHAGAPPVRRVRAHVGQEPRATSAPVRRSAPYLPEQAWFYAEDELTDRSERFLASELVREKLFRLTGDELPYTSTVVIDKFEEEPPPRKGHKRLVRIAATIVVERDSHKAMVIGDKGERIKRIGTEARVELEKLLDAKVFMELWVKVRSGWADDEARVRSFGYDSGRRGAGPCAGALGGILGRAPAPPMAARRSPTSPPTCCTATTGASPA
jgi:GTP-binding protein Era